MRLHAELPMSAPLEALEDVSDEVLMVRVAEGDVAAYETLYNRYKNRILTFVHRLVGDREWAEDLTQEVFLKVYRSPRSFDPRNRFMTWLFAVARNLTIDFLRRKRSSTSLTTDREDEGGIELEAEDGSPVDSTLMNELEERMQVVLMTLSDKLREVFVLCAIQGLSYEEVGQIVKCPAKTVSSRLSRARERFAESFQQYFSDSGSRP